MDATNFNIHLYTLTTPSDATNRLHATLKLKGLKYTHSPITLPPDAEYLDINPSGTAPTLIIQSTAKRLHGRAVFSQSLAALEYLEEVFPETNLLPPISRPEARAHVRTLVNIITADTHPLTTNRVQRSITSLFPGEAAEKARRTGNREWDVHWIRRGLGIYEQSLQAGEVGAGMYSAGDEVTLADVCLVPQCWTAERMGVHVANEFPVVADIVDRCMELQAFAAARSVHDS